MCSFATRISYGSQSTRRYVGNCMIGIREKNFLTKLYEKQGCCRKVLLKTFFFTKFEIWKRMSSEVKLLFYHSLTKDINSYEINPNNIAYDLFDKHVESKPFRFTFNIFIKGTIMLLKQELIWAIITLPYHTQNYLQICKRLDEILLALQICQHYKLQIALQI